MHFKHIFNQVCLFPHNILVEKSNYSDWRYRLFRQFFALIAKLLSRKVLAIIPRPWKEVLCKGSVLFMLQEQRWQDNLAFLVFRKQWWQWLCLVSQKGFANCGHEMKRPVIQVYLFPFCRTGKRIDLMISSYTFCAICCVVKTNIAMC